MSSLDRFAEAFAQLKTAWSEKRLAHAYLIAGSPSGAGLTFASSLLKLLYCEGSEPPCGACAMCHRVEKRNHPDISFLEPEKKSRIISVDQIRELNERLSQTAFSGGWKAAVILACDRLKEEAANAFLKTLEEPPGQTLLLLVTEQPQAMLPTIVSRCQRVMLEEGAATPVWMDQLLELLQKEDGDSPFEGMMVAGRLRQLLDSIREDIQENEKAAGADDADKDVLAARVQSKLIKERTEILRAVQFWQRDLLACRCGADDSLLHFQSHSAALRHQSGQLPLPALLRRVRGVEEAVRRLEVNMSEAVSLESYFLSATGMNPQADAR